MKLTTLHYKLLIVGLGAILFIPFLGSVHLFDWDEINFAECAREMLVTEDYFSVTINFQPFWEKPPLFIWMQALSMNFFGVNEFAARLPNAICGIATLLVLFNIGRKLYDNQFGLIWALVYIGSFLPHFYFKSGIIDPWFNLFIFSGIYYFIQFENLKSVYLLLISALLIGLGVLTKGPVAGLIVGLCISSYWMYSRFKAVVSFKHLLIYGFSIVFVGSLWFLMLFLSGNESIITEFFDYQIRLFETQDAGHGGPFIYHWIVLLIGCFPLSVFAIQGFSKSTSDSEKQKQFKVWMQILFWVVLILFSIVKTKIVHYSSLCYFPLSFLGAFAAYKIINREFQWKAWSSILLVFIASCIGVIFSAFPILDVNKDAIIESGLIKNQFTLENLNANVAWSGFEWVFGVFLIVGVLVMVLLIHKGRLKQGIIGLFIVSLITVNMTSIFITSRIEQYSQGAAIEFYESLQNKDCYVETIGFKSYAHLFYSKKRKPSNPESYSDAWLLRGDIDKPTYIVCKITSYTALSKKFPELKELYRKNGFVFFERLPK